MPVYTVQYQPETGQLMAAYRPIVFRVDAVQTNGDKIPPYVCCDVYVENVFYKTIFRTTPYQVLSMTTRFEFDIADALQEVLQPNLASATNQKPLSAPNMSAQVYVKFRSTLVDANGFTSEEGAIPVQANVDVPAVSGGGTQSNVFWVINAALQHEDNQNLSGHLDSFKTGTWDADAYPLTHRSRYFFCPKDADHYPLVYAGPCTQVELLLHVKRKGQNSFDAPIASVDPSPCNAVGFTVAVDMNNVTVTAPAPLVDPAFFVVQYKHTTDPESSWQTVGQGIGPVFTFAVPPSNPTPGDYIVRLITFCTPCLNADPIGHTFTIAASEVAWRGIYPACVVGATGTFFMKLVSRNAASGTVYYPNATVKNSQVDTNTLDYFVQFYSDSALLHPVNPGISGFTLYYARRASFVNSDSSGNTLFTSVSDNMIAATIDATAVEVLIGTLQVRQQTTNYSPYPTITNRTIETDAYRLFPDNIPHGYPTGQALYSQLQQYYVSSGVNSGVTKPNLSSDPDYIPPYTATALCPPGPAVVLASYASQLLVGKAQVRWDAAPGIAAGNVVYPTQTDSKGSGESYLAAVPNGAVSTIVVNAQTLVAGKTGPMFVLVNWLDSAGTSHTVKYGVTNGVETTIPALFPNLQSFNISNY